GGLGIPGCGRSGVNVDAAAQAVARGVLLGIGATLRLIPAHQHTVQHDRAATHADAASQGLASLSTRSGGTALSCISTIWQLLTTNEEESGLPNANVKSALERPPPTAAPPLAPAPPAPPRLSLRLTLQPVMIANELRSMSIPPPDAMPPAAPSAPWPPWQ